MRIRTGNSPEVLTLLWKETISLGMGTGEMNTLAEEYSGSTRFSNRMKTMRVIRWLNDVSGTMGRIPTEDLLRDWCDNGNISEKELAETLIIDKYERAIQSDRTIKQAKLEMVADLCVEMSIEDAIFNGITTK